MLLGKETIVWFTTMVEELAQREEVFEFARTSGDGNKAVIAHRCSNNSSHKGGEQSLYLAVMAYGGGGQRVFIVILEGQEREFGEVAYLELSLGKGSIAPPPC